jgi:hypothetical protein
MTTLFSTETQRNCGSSGCPKAHFKNGFCVDHYKEARIQESKKRQEEGEKEPPIPEKEAPFEKAQDGASTIVIKIPGTEAVGKITYFIVEAKRGNEPMKVRKCRFSEFFALNEQVKSFYAKNHKHLSGNLPAFPSKKLFQTREGPEFIESRRVELQDFLRQLIAVPHAQDNPLIFEFLGLGLPPTARLKLKAGESLTTIRMPKAIQKDGATFFTVEALTEPSREITQTLKRYSDFEAFNEKICDAYNDNWPQLVKSLPDFPIKRPKLLEDHDSKDFIESRRLLLQAYIVKLLKVPHAADNPHLWKFVGLVDYAYYAGQVNERLVHPDDRSPSTNTTPTTSRSSSLTNNNSTSGTSSSSSTSGTPSSVTSASSSSSVTTASSTSSSNSYTSLPSPSPKNTTASGTGGSGGSGLQSLTSGFSNLFKKDNTTTVTGVKKVQTRQKRGDSDDENDEL